MAHQIQLTIEKLGHRFGRQRLFAGLSLDATAPESICIAGRNGSGKSTLLRILAGLLEPTTGSATWTADGSKLDRTALRRHLGFISPDLHLYGELTLQENLLFFARLRGVPHAAADVAGHLETFGLTEHVHKRVATLSSGQKQRAKYIAATIHAPAILMLDEPTANLDRSGRSVVAQVVAAQRRSGLLLVATNEEEEYRFGNRLIRLDD